MSQQAQRYYERGVGSRTGIRPTVIPADPLAMRDQMLALSRQQQQRQPASRRRSSSQHSARPEPNNIAMYQSKYSRTSGAEQSAEIMSRSNSQRSLDRARQSQSAELDLNNGPEQAYDDSDQTESADEDDEEEDDGQDDQDEDEAPSPARRRVAPTKKGPASLFTNANASATFKTTKNQKAQSGDSSWFDQAAEQDDDEQSEDSSASNSKSRPRPRLSKSRSRPSSDQTLTTQSSPGTDKRKASSTKASNPSARAAKRAKANSASTTKESTTGSTKRGRPRKQPDPAPELSSDEEPEADLGTPEPSDEEEEAPAPAKRGRGRPRKGAAPPKKATTKPTKDAPRFNGRARVQASVPVEEDVPEPDRASTEKPEGLRRSSRHRIKPLEWWRGERAEYGRPSDHQGATNEVPGPTLRKIYRVNRADGEGTFSGLHFGKTKRSRNAPARRKAQPPAASSSRTRFNATPATPEPINESDDEEHIYLDPTADNVAVEDGMDAETERMQVVWDPDLGQEVERSIACTSMQTNPQMTQGRNYAFEKLLSADDALAAGILSIPVGGSKPTKSSKDNNYVFVVIQGAATIKVGRSEFVLAPGGMFLVPRGNNYSIENAAQRELKLFFTQTRNVSPAAMALRASVQPRLSRGPGTPGPARLPSSRH